MLLLLLLLPCGVLRAQLQALLLLWLNRQLLRLAAGLCGTTGLLTAAQLAAPRHRTVIAGVLAHCCPLQRRLEARCCR